MTPRGHPDYVTPVAQVYIEGLAGLEELAARLGSIVPWDLHGNIVLMEDFESEETEWSDTHCSDDCTMTRSSLQKRSGDWSCKLYNNGKITDSASAYRELHYPGALKYGLSAQLCWDIWMQEISVMATFYTGSRIAYVDVNYNILDKILKVGSGGGWYTVATNLRLYPLVGFTWHPIVVLFDIENLVYNKLYFNDTEYDLTDIPLTFSVITLDPLVAIQVVTIARAAAAFTTYVDDIILVKNLP